MRKAIRFQMYIGGDASGKTYVTFYLARHSFPAWSMIVGINTLLLVKFRGHASKQMVYEVYGNYVEGLVENAERILGYFRTDFVMSWKSKSPIPLRDSIGDSLKSSVPSTRTPCIFLERETGFEGNCIEDSFP